MPAVPIFETESGGELRLPPVDLTEPAKPFTTRVYLRNAGSTPLYNAGVWVEGDGLQVGHPDRRTFSREVRDLGDVAPGERVAVLLRRPGSRARGRQEVMLHARGLSET